MRKVGHYSKARLVQDWYWTNIDNFCWYECMLGYFQLDEQCPECGCGETEPLPTGFSIISAGCFRIVFHHIPTNVVYKIEHSPDDESEYSNAEEHRNYRRLMKRATNEGIIGEYIRVPITTKYGDVIAMEFVANKRGAIPSVARDELARLGISDMHMGNWVYDGKYINPIDLASEYYYEAV